MRRWGSCLAIVLALAGTAVGCGSSGSDEAAPPEVPEESTGPTTEPTEIVPDAMVTAGLSVVRTQSAGVAQALADGDQAGAKAQAKEMYQSWYGFEATVRQNEKDLYLQMEDGLADIQAGARDGKADRVEKGKKDLEEGATAYLEKHP